MNNEQFEQFAIDRLGDKIKVDHYCALGIASEAGELCGLHRSPGFNSSYNIDMDIVADVVLELSDILYYAAGEARGADVTLAFVMDVGVAKLKRRDEHGKDKLAERTLAKDMIKEYRRRRHGQPSAEAAMAMILAKIEEIQRLNDEVDALEAIVRSGDIKESLGQSSRLCARLPKWPR